MKRVLSDDSRATENARRLKAWNKQAAKYDKQIGWFERHVFGDDNRAWACNRAKGDVLEVAVGTGLNIPLYPQNVRLTGIDISPAMLGIARGRASDGSIGRPSRR